MTKLRTNANNHIKQDGPMENATVWTAAVCQGDPGPGGYAVIIVFEQGPPISKNNGRRKTTRHRMEMYAAIRALTTLETPHNVNIKTIDVQLVHAVGARDFRKAEDLAEHLLPLLEIHNVVVTMNKDKNTPEYQETYARALRASRSNPPNPDTGYEKQQAKISQQPE